LRPHSADAAVILSNIDFVTQPWVTTSTLPIVSL